MSLTREVIANSRRLSSEDKEAKLPPVSEFDYMISTSARLKKIDSLRDRKRIEKFPAGFGLAMNTSKQLDLIKIPILTDDINTQFKFTSCFAGDSHDFQTLEQPLSQCSFGAQMLIDTDVRSRITAPKLISLELPRSQSIVISTLSDSKQKKIKKLTHRRNFNEENSRDYEFAQRVLDASSSLNGKMASLFNMSITFFYSKHKKLKIYFLFSILEK